jgi:hypothetical protein
MAPLAHLFPRVMKITALSDFPMRLKPLALVGTAAAVAQQVIGGVPVEGSD